MPVKPSNRAPRVNVVPAQWPKHLPCKIAFVAEAPSDEERMHQPPRPLVGPSGRVFDQLLRTAGLDRSQYLVTNVFNEQLPNNEVVGWCAPTLEKVAWPDYALPRLSAGWLRPEYGKHLARLQAELERAAPTCIVPLGGTALWALTGHDDIMQMRGATAQATRLVPGTKLLPTLHPAHVMREWRMFSIVVGDLIKAAHEAEFPEVRLKHRELWLEPSILDMHNFADRYMKNADLLSVDIETAAGQITCIGFAPSSERAIVVPFVDYRNPNRSYWPDVALEVTAVEWVDKWLKTPIPKLFQNGLYDVFWLINHGYTVNGYRQDTRLLHHALYPELPKDLGFMGANYASAPAWKTMRAMPKSQEKRDA